MVHPLPVQTLMYAAYLLLTHTSTRYPLHLLQDPSPFYSPPCAFERQPTTLLFIPSRFNLMYAAYLLLTHTSTRYPLLLKNHPPFHSPSWLAQHSELRNLCCLPISEYDSLPAPPAAAPPPSCSLSWPSGAIHRSVIHTLPL